MFNINIVLSSIKNSYDQNPTLNIFNSCNDAIVIKFSCFNNNPLLEPKFYIKVVSLMASTYDQNLISAGSCMCSKLFMI